MLISLMLMLMLKCVIEERTRDTEAIPAFNTNDKKLAVARLSLIIRRAKRVFNFSLAPRVERRNQRQKQSMTAFSKVIWRD